MGVNLVLRRLARDQWIRIHGTPRITVLVGAGADRLWRDWLAIAQLPGTLFDGELDRAIRDAYASAIATPEHPVAIVTNAIDVECWRANRTDRLGAMVDEGLLAVPPSAPASRIDARSAAEAAMFEALEAVPATSGRFLLNQYLPVRFGADAAQVDLLSRGDRIAIEIDGYHHFTDPERYRRDRRKDLLLQTQGLFVLRFLAEDVMRDPREAMTAVMQALAHRLGGSS